MYLSQPCIKTTPSVNRQESEWKHLISRLSWQSLFKVQSTVYHKVSLLFLICYILIYYTAALCIIPENFELFLNCLLW